MTTFTIALLLVLLVVLAITVVAVGWTLRLRAQRSADHLADIDPFSVGEPWRAFVSSAVQSQTRFRSTVAATAPGPRRDRLDQIGGHLRQAVDETWRVAKLGNQLSKHRKFVDLPVTRDRLEAITGTDPDSEETRNAVQGQIDSAERVEAKILDAQSRLRLLEARMAESVARAAELSVDTASSDGLGMLDLDVSHLVGDLEALRLALEETEQAAG